MFFDIVATTLLLLV